MKSFEELLVGHRLSRFEKVILEFYEPALALSLGPNVDCAKEGTSKIGGEAHLPPDVDWPKRAGGRPLDFLLQINFAEIQLPGSDLLPADGLASFFYDLDDQPWGYDPKNLDGFVVLYTPSVSRVKPRPAPNPEFQMPEFRVSSRPMDSFPHPGSRAMHDLFEAADFDDDEWDRYWDFVLDSDSRFYDERAGSHRILGYSSNVQGDMQLQAALVSAGLYCGNSTGYKDPRREALEATCDEWRLLLQLDSDDRIESMWGDDGMLYFWIREDDLRARRFDKVWMTMQCH